MNGEQTNTNGFENGQNYDLQSYSDHMLNKSNGMVNPRDIELVGLPQLGN